MLVAVVAAVVAVAAAGAVWGRDSIEGWLALPALAVAAAVAAAAAAAVAENYVNSHIMHTTSHLLC